MENQEKNDIKLEKAETFAINFLYIIYIWEGIELQEGAIITGYVHKRYQHSLEDLI